MRALLATLLAAAIAAALAAPATAAPYTVWSCRDANGSPLSTRAWLPAGNAGSRTDACATGGSLEVALGLGDTAARSVSAYRFDVPPGVAIVGYTAWLAAEAHSTPGPQPYVAGLGQLDELDVPTVLDGCPATSPPSCASGDFTVPLASGNEVTHTGQVRELAFMAACASTDPCSPAADPPARAALFRSEVVLDDPSSPLVGPLAALDTASGVRAITAALTDDGSGLRRAELLVDGRLVDAQDEPCAPPYTVADPCPGSLRATFALATAALAQGVHVVAVRAIDAAGNAAQSAPLRVSVVHPAPPRPVIVQKLPLTLRVTTPTRVRLPTSRAVTGAVSSAAGGPLAGLRMRFEQRAFDEDRWHAMRKTAITDAGGRFALPVPSASAQVRALPPATFSATPAVTDFVRPLAATIRASTRRLRNGRRLTLRGRLLHAGGAADGRLVLVQSRVGGGWHTVDSLDTRANGAIRWRYRFTHTLATARYRFRFVVPRVKPLPWSRVVSRQVSVLVRADRGAG